MSLMDLNAARGGYEYHSGKASDVARQLAFAAIAVIWIFRTNHDASLGVPERLVLPALLAVAALACDFLQYVLATIAWGAFTRWKEQQEDVLADPTVRFVAPRQLNWPGNTFFALKLLFTACSYSFLIEFLLGRVVA